MNKKKKTWGIVLLVLSALALLGSLVNGTYANGIGISELTTIALIIGMAIGGARLLKKEKDGQK